MLEVLRCLRGLDPTWSLSGLNASRPHWEQQLLSFILRSVPVTSTWRTTSLLYREVGCCWRVPLSFSPCLALMLMCSTGRGGKKRAAAENKKEISLVRIICFFFLWDLNTMNPPRIRVWSWMGIVLPAVTERLQIYVENKALSNFPGWVSKKTMRVRFLFTPVT